MKQTGANLEGIIKDAATAFASALKTPSPDDSVQSSTLGQAQSTCRPSKACGLSPNTRASLRRSHYQDLSTLKQLQENCVLTSDEFEEQKRAILQELRSVSKQ